MLDADYYLRVGMVPYWRLAGVDAFMRFSKHVRRLLWALKGVGGVWFALQGDTSCAGAAR